MPAQNRNVMLILGTGFFFIFFGFNGVQQFITIFFNSENSQRVGFVSLLLIYAFFILFNIFVPTIINKIGIKKSLLVSSCFYTVYILSLLSKNPFLIYCTSILLGAAGTLLWTSQNSYLVSHSDQKELGKNAGIFGTLFFAGSGIGALLIGFLVNAFGFVVPFIIYAAMPIIGFMVLFFLKEKERVKIISPIKSLLKVIKNSTIWRLSSIWFSFNFTYGLIIGLIPLQISQQLNFVWASAISTFFYLLPILFSYRLGSSSDVRGRRIFIAISYLLSIFGIILLIQNVSTLLLLLGVLLLSINFALSRTITFALIGDIAPSEAIESTSAFMWAIQGFGTLLAILVSIIVRGTGAYIISLIIIIISFLILLPLRKKNNLEIQKLIFNHIRT